MTTEVSKRVLVLGASGMLGNAVLRLFAVSPGFEVTGSVRSLTHWLRWRPSFDKGSWQALTWRITTVWSS